MEMIPDPTVSPANPCLDWNGGSEQVRMLRISLYAVFLSFPFRNFHRSYERCSRKIDHYFFYF